MKYGEDMSFENFLEKLKLTEKEYLTAVSFSLKRETLFLKRAASEIRINNNYNSVLLRTWQANMDIQYVLGAYACAVYILSYITKGQRGMSKLLEIACEEAKSGNTTINDKVRHIGNKFLNAVEVSAQEAVYLVLQMPLRRASREVQFVNTSNPTERTFLLKSLDKIQELPENSEDIEVDNLIKKYQIRSRQLEKVCLADFAAWFKCVGSQDTNCDTSDPVDYPLETNFNTDDYPSLENDDCYNEEYYLKGGIKLLKRKKAKIICSVRFDKNKDAENYCREQLMLYTCWRKECTDLIANCSTYQERYEKLKNILVKNRKAYEIFEKFF